MSAVKFTPDGNALVSGSFDQTLKLWDVSALSGRRGKAARGVKNGKRVDESTSFTMNLTGHKVHFIWPR